ncbi:MAG: BofC C-terminal domain-containing protein [Eubacterium sp.]|nr:BofC C-terminal domain-containing protein [Eubacterium sp.]
MTKYRICLIALLIASLITLGMLSGYFFLTPDPKTIAAENKALKAVIEEAASAPAEAIGSSTKITYEYIYLGGHKETSETRAPKNWQGLTLSEFKEIFDGWQIKEFSSDEVVLAKVLNAYSPKHYVLGEYEGNVAVYRKNEYEEKTVKQVTSTPVESLPEDERKRLETGIDFYGDEALVKILEDYET